MMKFSKFGSFDVYVNCEYLCRFRCSYGEVLDLIWSMHYDDPTANIEIRFVGYDDSYHEE